MNYISPVAYAETLNTFRGNYTNLKESDEDNICLDAKQHEWKKVGKEKAKCKKCGMEKVISYGYEPEKSFEYGQKNKMREGKMSESRIRFESLKQKLSPEEQEQLSEYLDSLKEIKKTIRELLMKGASKPRGAEIEETGGNMMRKWMKESKKK